MKVAEPKTQELWFLTGSQHLYGDETLKAVARNSQQIAESLDRSGKLPAKRGVEADPDRPRRHPGSVPGGQRGAGVRGRHHLDAHLLARQDVDRAA